MHIEKKRFFEQLASYFFMEREKVRAIASGAITSESKGEVNPATFQEFLRQLEIAYSSILWISRAYGETIPKSLLGPIDSVNVHGMFSTKIEDDK